jgi:hypothetical protein
VAVQDAATLLAKQRDVNVIWVTGVPGWGKSWFADLVLDALGHPVRIVDLAGCAGAYVISERLVAGLQLTEREELSLDSDPLAAVSVVLLRARHRGAVLLENAEVSPDGTVAERLVEYVEALTQAHVPVLIETWSLQVDWGPLTGSIHRPDIPALTTEETLTWAGNLGIDLSGAHIEALDLLDGHPRLLHGVLHRLRTEALDPRAILDIAATADEANHRRPELNWATAALLTRVALLPWNVIRDDELTDIQRIDMPLLAASGFFHRRATASEWVPSAWVRVEALRRLKGGLYDSSLVDRTPAATVVPGKLPFAVRHLENLRLHLPADHPATSSGIVVRLLRALPATDDDGAYVAPWIVATASQGASSTFAMILAAEGAARVASRVDETHFNVLLKQEDLFETLVERWQYVKAFHTALVRGSLSLSSRVAACNVVARAARHFELPLPVATRAWLARLLAVGARTARMSFDFQSAVELSSAALAILPEAPARDEYARSVNLDTRYLIASASTLAPQSSAEEVLGQVAALEAIPPPSLWMAQMEDKWRERTLWHLRELCRIDPSPLFTAQVVHTFDDWGPNVGWVVAFRLFRDLWDTWSPEMRRSLQDVLRRATKRLTGEDASRIGELLRFLGSPSLPLDDCLARLRSAIPPRDAIDREMIRLALQMVDRESFLPGDRGRFLALIELAIEAILRSYDGSGADHGHDGGVLDRLLDRWIDHHLYWDAGHDAGTASTRLSRAAARLDHQFSSVISRTADAGFYVSWCEARLRLARTWRFVQNKHLERQDPSSKVGVAFERAISNGLTDLAQRIVGESKRHPAAMVGALLIHRYLWNHRQCFEFIEAFSADDFHAAGRIRSIRICAEVLERIVLTPDSLRAAAFTDEELARASSCLQNLLEILAMHGGDRQHRRWWMTMAEVIVTPSEDTWRRFVDANAERMGTPEEYWKRVLEATLADPPATQPEDRYRVSDLTDVGELTLAGNLLRKGALQDDLPMQLRREVANLAVVMACDAETWNRSTIHPERLLDTWRAAVAIGIALLLSPDGRVLDRATSFRRAGRRGPASWWTHCRDNLDEVIQKAPANFSQHALRVKEWLTEAVPKQYRV